MVKKVCMLNTGMKRPFFFMFSPSMCTHFPKKSQRVLCAAGSATRSTDQPHNYQSSQLITVLYQLSAALELSQGEGFLCLSGVQPVTPTDHLSLQQKAVGDLYCFSSLKAVFCLLSPSFPLNSIIQQKVENLLLRVKSKACDECHSSWKHPSLGVSLC